MLTKFEMNSPKNTPMLVKIVFPDLTEVCATIFITLIRYH